MSGLNDASLFPDLPLPTVPLDEALTVLRQPAQPPVDPNSFQAAVDSAHMQANTPTLVNSFLDTLSQHAQEQQQRQQEEELQRQAQAQQDQAQQAAQQQQAQQVQQDQAQLQPQQAAVPEIQTGSTSVPAPVAVPSTDAPVDDSLPSPHEKAVGNVVALANTEADQARQAQQVQKFAQGLLSTPEGQQVLESATMPQGDQQQERYRSPQERFAQGLITSELPSTVPAIPGGDPRLTDLYKEAQLPMTREEMLPQGVGLLGGAENAARAGQELAGQVLTPLTAAGKLAGLGFAKALQGVNALPYVGPYLQPFPSIARAVGISDQKQQQIAEQVGGFVAPAAADIASGGALSPVFLGQAADAVALTGAEYARGDLSGKDALKQLLVQAGPFILPALLHAAGPLANFARSEEGQQFISEWILAKPPEGAVEGGVASPELAAAGERGAITPGRAKGAKTEKLPAAVEPAAPTEPTEPTTAEDDVFARMPLDVLQKQADYGVGGAKAELARRGVSAEEAPPTAPAARTPEEIAADLASRQGGVKNARVEKAFAAKLAQAEDPEAVAARAQQIADRRGGSVGLFHLNTALKEERTGVTVRQAEPEAAPAPAPVPEEAAIQQQQQVAIAPETVPTPGQLTPEQTTERQQLQSHLNELLTEKAGLERQQSLNTNRGKPRVLARVAKRIDAIVGETVPIYNRLEELARPEAAAPEVAAPALAPAAAPSNIERAQSLGFKGNRDINRVKSYLEGAENPDAVVQRAQELAQADGSKVLIKHIRAALAEEAGVPAAVTEQLDTAATQMKAHGQSEEAAAVEAITAPLNDEQSAAVAVGDVPPPGPVEAEAAAEGAAEAPAAAASGNAGAAGTGGTGGSKVRSTPIKRQPPTAAQTDRMSAFSKVFREMQRQSGIEVGDPKPIRTLITNVNRQKAAALSEAEQLGHEYSQSLNGLGDFQIDPTTMPDEARQALASHPEAAAAMAISNPWMFKLTPEQESYVNDYVQTMERVKKAAKKAGLKIGTQSDDTNYFPRHTLEANGRPVVTTASSFTQGRTAGTLYDAINSGNEYAYDPGLALQAHLESVALTRANAELVEGLKKMGNIDGKGKILKYGSRNGIDGYSPVANLSEPDKFGRMWLARDGRAHELLTNTFSNGLPDVARLATAPSRLSRSLEFSVGMFHAAYGNFSLALTDLRSFFKALPNEIQRTTTEAGREAQRTEDYQYSQLHQLTGGQLSNVDRFGGARRTIRQAQGLPEAEPMIPRNVKLAGKEVPTGIGQLSQASHTILFEGVMPKVQIAAFRANLRWLQAHKPDLIPDNFGDVMASGDKPAVEEMLNQNPAFKQALEQISARTNHSMGFTESTLGRGERGLSQAWLNTPTITRAIAANVRDTFLAPGNIQGALARRWWINAAADFGTVAVGGTLLAFKGDAKKAFESGYLDPSSNRFVLNPNNGKYFMAIALPSGTTVNLMPSPMRTPLRIMTSPAVTAAEEVQSGEALSNPLQAAKNVGLNAVQGTGQGGLSGFVQTRLGADIPLAEAAAAGLGSGLTGAGGKKALQAAGNFATGAVPLPVQAAVQNPPTSLEAAKQQAIESGGRFVGADLRQATARENLDNYLRSQTNPDGSQRFPQGLQSANTTGIQTFLVQDQRAKQLYSDYQQNRIANGTPESQAIATAQTQRAKSLDAAAQTYAQSKATNPYAGQVYRQTITNVRHQASEAERQVALQSATTDPQRALINSWYDLYQQATDSAGGLHTDNYTDPVTGEEKPGLDALQATWEQKNPGVYKSVIEPNELEGVSRVLPDGSPNPEYQLRKDRQLLTDSGWWQTPQQAWQQTQQAALKSHINLMKYQTEGDYAKATLLNLIQTAKQTFAKRGQQLTDAQAQAIAQTYLGKDRVISYFGKYRTYLRVHMLKQSPDLLAALTAWGYGTPTKQEIAAAMSSQ